MTCEATHAAQRGGTTLGTIARRILRPFLLAVGTGAALMYLFDPERGRTRRALVRDRTAGTMHRLSRRVERTGRRAASEVYAVKQKATHLRPEDTEIPNDPDLVLRVETELFRDPEIPKGDININAEDGKIVLRGEIARPDVIRTIERKVRKVHGVREVENLMHLPGMPAPNKADALHANG